MEKEESYLGDGLYVSFDGWQIILRAPRHHGDHYVALEPATFRNLLEYIANRVDLKKHMEKGR